MLIEGILDQAWDEERRTKDKAQSTNKDQLTKAKSVYVVGHLKRPSLPLRQS